MKKIKLKYVGFYQGFNVEYDHIYKILKKHYDVELSEEPDYIICSVFGKPYEYCKYDQVRIMHVGENYIPDFNLVDYAISRYPLVLQDRNFYLPGCVSPFVRWIKIAQKDRSYPDEILKEKEFFANFITSHESEYSIRGDFFKKLCEYKRVESPGTYLNNMPNGETVKWTNESKTSFQRKCKFTLCFESTKHEGFITEKISDAFWADTIPVYYGSSSVTEIFNPEAFINCSDYDSFDDVIKRIIDLDNDDAQYLEMLRKPILVDEKYPNQLFENLEKWVVHIFDQPIEKAYRRSRVYYPKEYNDALADKFVRTKIEVACRKIQSITKKIRKKIFEI